jgi:hypothetical protein
MASICISVNRTPGLTVLTNFVISACKVYEEFTIIEDCQLLEVLEVRIKAHLETYDSGETCLARACHLRQSPRIVRVESLEYHLHLLVNNGFFAEPAFHFKSTNMRPFLSHQPHRPHLADKVQGTRPQARRYGRDICLAFFQVKSRRQFLYLRIALHALDDQFIADLIL